MLDRVETKFPFVRSYGETTFDVDKNTKDLLQANSEEGLRKNMSVLKEAKGYMSKEVTAYLFDNYGSFLRTSESLRQVHSEFEELKTMSNQYNLVLSAIKTQVDRLTAPSGSSKSEVSESKVSSKMNKERELKLQAE